MSTEMRPSLLQYDVVQMQQQGELVENQRDADADQDRGDDRPRARTRSADRDEGADDQQHQPGNGVVDVHSTTGDLVPKGSAAGPDRPGDGAGDQEGQHEGKKAHHQRELVRPDDVALPPAIHRRSLANCPHTDGCAHSRSRRCVLSHAGSRWLFGLGRQAFQDGGGGDRWRWLEPGRWHWQG